MSEIVHGACLCGKVAFQIQDPKVLVGCHCTRCTRWSGSGGTSVVVVGARDFEVTSGKELMKRYSEGKFADRYFCGNCGSGIYTDGGDSYYVSAGVLRGLNMKTAFHIQVAHKASWDEIGGSAPQYAEYAPK